jgi:hypothetical protein
MFKCLECGRKFKTTKAAEKAAFGDRGCPGCGGSDIDLDVGPDYCDKWVSDNAFTGPTKERCRRDRGHPGPCRGLTV